MVFHILADRPWLAGNIAPGNLRDEELLYLASLSPDGVGENSLIAERDLYRPGAKRRVHEATWQALRFFFSEDIVRDDIVISDHDGNMIEELAVFDDGDGALDVPVKPEKPGSFGTTRTDLVFRRLPGGEWRDITTEVVDIGNDLLRRYFYVKNPETGEVELTRRPVDFLAMYEELAHGGAREPAVSAGQPPPQALAANISTALLLTLYRISRAAKLSTLADPPPLAGVVNFGEIRAVTDRLDARSGADPSRDAGPLERIFVASILASLLVELKYRHARDKTYSDQVSLIVTHANHLVNVTAGEVGLGIYRHLDTTEWRLVLANAGNAMAVAETLARAIAESGSGRTGRFPSPSPSPPRRPRRDELIAILQDESSYDAWFRAVVATAFLMAGADDPSLLSEAPPGHRADGGETVTDLVFKVLDGFHEPENGRSYPYPPLVKLVLSSLGTLSLSADAPQNARARGFAWCRAFYANFESFVTPADPPDRRAEVRNEDRRLIALCQDVMVALAPEPSRQVFLREIFSDLDPGFDPRARRELAHNAYYRRVGAAENLALLAGRRHLAFTRRLDQENNEWGRLVERAVRDNEVFRLDLMKEAEAKFSGKPSPVVEKALARFDPRGVIRRNAAYVHALRYLYTNRLRLDPASEPAGDCATYIEALDFDTVLTSRFSAGVYESEARAFDEWILDLERNNPDFTQALKARVRGLGPRIAALPAETAFLEANEMEFWQFALDPVEGPLAQINFVGVIRSWTSGYHGRVFTRIKAFMDQDRIRRDREFHPDTYRPPIAYYPEYAAVMGRERFEATILPVLNEAVNPIGDPALNFQAREALLIMRHFGDSGFSAYLPSWLLFIIAHRFTGKEGENLDPLRRAFDLIGETAFPREVVREIFETHGYLEEPAPGRNGRTRQGIVKRTAEACLKKLDDVPASSVPYRGEDFAVRRRVVRAAKGSFDPLPAPYHELVRKFTAPEVEPGEFHDYPRQARLLLKTGTTEAVRLIMEEALVQKTVKPAPNAPLRPLFRGLPGRVVSNEKLDTAIINIAVSSRSSGKGLGALVNFSAIMIHWARKNRIDLTEAFSEAMSDYRTPPDILVLQRDVERARGVLAELERELAHCRSDPRINGEPDDIEDRRRELKAALRAAEDRRDAAIVSMIHDAERRGEQAVFQFIESLYNAIRRQYLKEILITGGPATGRLIESYLEDVLIPEKRRLMTDLGDDVSEWLNKVLAVERRIAFLMDVLAGMEREQVSSLPPIAAPATHAR